MHSISANDYELEIGSILDSSFASLLDKYSDVKKIIVSDDNTSEHCVPFLISNYDGLAEAEVVILPAGEENKSLAIVANVWELLTEYGLGRHDLIINVGGGVVTDMGGFIASCYKRGMQFINIPTSLLSMVDASIGGKTGVNLDHYKNQIGVFNDPEAVYIDPIFLSTLESNELLSGYAEMIKHGLIHSTDLFNKVIEQLDIPFELELELLKESIQVKNEVVKRDPLEGGERKILNFGHTIGHVIEGFMLGSEGMTHGHAVGIGMVFEAYLSTKKGKLSQEEFKTIESAILDVFPVPTFSNDDIQSMTALLTNDKKNKGGKILCCLLEKIGECTFDHEISEQEVTEVFLHYKNQQINLN
ncbi:MAG: 3-dehydroquinate synthase [Crocinitomicaceae bacterium]|jgi:3-dehydroquinate synthase|nr:3-dehydroquinate synthase [Crocinitomicaceae bacterium]MDG1658408.1 3-dehydroquinate synthase [Crocinitomicaceae bacterium]